MIMNKLLNKLTIRAQLAFSDLLHNERGEVNIVAIVILIGVAVLLAIVFRKQIGDLLNTLFGTIENNAKNAIN